MMSYKRMVVVVAAWIAASVANGIASPTPDEVVPNPSSGSEFGAESAVELRDRLLKAIMNKNREDFFHLSNYPALAESVKQRLALSTPGSFGFSRPKVELAPLRAEDTKPIDFGEGLVFDWDVQPVGLLIITDAADPEAVEFGMVYGTLNGRYYLGSRVKRRSSEPSDNEPKSDASDEDNH